MSFVGIVVLIVTAICLYFLTWKRIQNGSNISRFFYVISIVAFYVGLFRTSSSSLLGALLDAVVAGVFWFSIGFLAEYLSNKKQNISAVLPIADELKKLSILRDENIITEEEFNQQKKKLLSN